MKKFRSFKLIDLFRAVSLFDAVLFIVLIVLPTVVLAKGKPFDKPVSSRASARQGNPVSISSINPNSAAMGQALTVTGTGFKALNEIRIQGKIIGQFASIDENTIIFQLPASIGCNVGASCPIQVINDSGRSNAYPITLSQSNPGPVIPELIITSEILDSGQVATPYSITLSAEGGNQPYSWSISSGSLPGGLDLNPTTGGITGIPEVPGTYQFSVRVNDSNLDENQKTFSILIEPELITDPNQPLDELERLIILGRFIDIFTGEPVADIDFFQTGFNTGDTVIEKSDVNGKFKIDTRIDNMTMNSPSKVKSFSYSPKCYTRGQVVGVTRLHEDTVSIYATQIDLEKSFDRFEVDLFGSKIATVDIGDQTLWPATNVRFTSDIPMTASVMLPLDGRGSGRTNYLTEHYFSRYIAPFDYPLQLIAADELGNVYESPEYYHDYQHGCEQSLQVHVNANGEFSFTPSSTQQ